MTRDLSSNWRCTVGLAAVVTTLVTGAGLHRAAAADGRVKNRLIDETSPYLQQHAHNPVDWFPWGEEAFARAQRENKPVFLSVGYSTCYWCHVMEQESFEDPVVARLLNEHFVAIKVDREERPELDAHYLAATQVMTGKGGWPNSVWLTPDGEPWLASTYLPKSRFVALLQRAAQRWKSRPADVKRDVAAIAAALAKTIPGSAPSPGAPALSAAMIEEATRAFLREFDPKHGGFGGAPKFPAHGAIAFLLQQCAASNDEDLRRAIAKSLDAMWLGGLHDHVGGGFHRYATDERWLVPHFEKMLYDNAQLLRAYTGGYQLTGESRYREAVEDIFVWLQRDMTSPEGAFYSAIDAGEAGREGAAYVWRLSQVLDVLGPVDGARFASIYHIEERGNFMDETTGKRRGTNIPYLDEPVDAIATPGGEDATTLATRLAGWRARLLAHRQTWPRPRTDDKILASWNGLMIGALAHAGQELREPRYRAAAIRAGEFLRQSMMSNSTLRHLARAGEGRLAGYLDDYAFVAAGFLDLYRATNDPVWLTHTEQLAATMLSDFQDEQDGGFFFTGREHDDRILRAKNLHSGSNQPDANGAAIQVLLDLARLTGKPEYDIAARRALESLAGHWRQQPWGSEQGLIAVSEFFRPTAPVPAQLEEAGLVPAFAGRVAAVSIRAYASQLHPRPGDELEVSVALDIDPGWHLYDEMAGADFLIPTSVECTNAGPFIVRQMDRPAAEPVPDRVLGHSVNVYRGRIVFRLHLTVDPAAPGGAVVLPLRVITQACDDTRCLAAETTDVRIPFTIDSSAKPE